ncbi:MAG: toprim domain-containing protein [Prevotella sp.]|nr:toprim domain-containing protein [Alistipes senegalensis]MCM1357694.1 toprim domain-containing protein [Prevotella sp.]MCM1473433.1 toprim domain-containing protein [Muribaculaceae bacterium]
MNEEIEEELPSPEEITARYANLGRHLDSIKFPEQEKKAETQPAKNSQPHKNADVHKFYKGSYNMNNDNIERIKIFLLDYVQEITQPSRNGGKNQYICPLCDSGTGSHQSGAFTVYPDTNSYHCFACGANGDIFNLYGEMNNISDFSTISKELQAKYGVTNAQPIRQKKQPLKPAPTKQEIDFSVFLNNAEKHLYKTDYLTKRGLSLNTQRKFHCGYVSNYSYHNNTKTTPAITIPTSNTSFMWRSTTENIKQKRGVTHILNPSALTTPYCFVVEGEIDCMSIDECGFACIGLGSTSNIKKIFDYDTSKTVLIIAMDNDFPGAQATRELEKLCDEHQTPYITTPQDVWSGCKDANELLVKDRKELVKSLQTFSDEALRLDKDKWLQELDRRKKEDADWKSGLLRNVTNNAVKNTLQNLELIFYNDPTYSGKIEFNELTQMMTFDRKDWRDVTENRIKLYLEKEYTLYTSIDSINQMCSIIADDNSYHPIKEYLNAVRWDGVQRIKRVFSDFLGAADNMYTQAVAVITFVGAVARVFEAGVKFDTCTVLVGRQGTGKSKFIGKIAVKPEWFTDGVTTFDGKDFYESIQGKWIIELGEGTAFQKSIKERSKQAIASQQDFYRKPYGRNPEQRPRQCVFLGTTNNYDFLKDETGDRRYYPIDVNIAKATKNIDRDLTDTYISQLWAEAVQLYRGGQSIYIQDKQVLALAEQEQRKHFDESPLQADIYNFLEIPITSSWYDTSIEGRRKYILDYQEGITTAGAYKRDRISVKEIVCELFGYELNQPIDRKMSLEIARTLTALGWIKNGKKMWLNIYGAQWIYVK